MNMPDSPPKRITRARAKAAEQEPATKTTKAAKAVPAGTKTTTTRATKRKARTDDVEEEAITVEIPKSSAAKRDLPAKVTKGRSKRAAPIVGEAPGDTIIAEPAPPAVEKVDQPKTTRGRTRKAVPAETKIEEDPEKEDAPKPKRAPRSRAAATAAAVLTKPAATRKKVSFQDDLNKENIVPVEDFRKAPSPKKAPEKATGLKAKPVRKPIASRTTRSAKKAVASSAEKTEKDDLPPLSPKKAKQIPITQTASDDDELAGAKTPLRAMSKSPVKIQFNRGDTGENGVSKLNLNTSIVVSCQDGLSTAEILQSGQKFGSSILGSPARRPPPSPFKDLLKESPKKINLRESAQQFSLTAPPTSFKASLLQSPAKRPRSPTKGVTHGSPQSPVKDQIQAPDGPRIGSPLFTCDEAITSPLKIAKSPERPVKMHKMTVEEQFEQEEIIEPSSPLLSAFEFDPNVKRRTPARPVVKTARSSVKPSRIPTALKSPPVSPTQNTFSVLQKSEKLDDSASMEKKGVEIKRSTTPPGLPAQAPDKAFVMKTPSTAYQITDDSDSGDELQSKHRDYSPTPVSHHRLSVGDFGASSIPVSSKNTLVRKAAKGNLLTNTTSIPSSVDEIQQAQAISLTPLVSQFGNLAVACPKNMSVQQTRQAQRNLFSPSAPKLLPQPAEEAPVPVHFSPVKSSFFDDEMSVREQQEEMEGMVEPPPTEISEASQEYGDENAIPIDPRLLDEDIVTSVTCTPSKVFSIAPQEVHTVQRVPLKPAAEDSPSKPHLKRSASFSDRSSSRKEFVSSALTMGGGLPSFLVGSATPTQPLTVLTQAYTAPTKSVLPPQRTPGTGAWSMAGTPARTPRRYVDPGTLKGAIVYVDVHTVEGADASGIFVDLLTQMGARCVKQWNWNPSNNATSAVGDNGFGLGGTDDGIKAAGHVGTPGGSGQGTTTPGGKIGITHVVFKDGGVRTLQKVRESKGVVLCVGVGWVLDCERGARWLDESDYAVDISTIPRGGHRRRKSMEPRALANMNGTLVLSDSPATTRNTPAPPPISPTEEFLTFDTPTCRRESFSIPPPAPETPKTVGPKDISDYDAMSFTSSPGSPTTPYFLHPTEITQQTCPPKQQFQPRLLFPASGGTEDEPDAGLRQRLLLARRKSLQWAPKVGSPLGKAVSYAG